MDDLTSIVRLIEALRPWLRDLVFVGGWAHRLYRLHPAARAPLYMPVQTRDADVAFSVSTPLVGDIGAALTDAGFEKELSGDHTPPVTRYKLGTEDQGFYAEFLAPLQGDGLKRNGEPDVTVTRAGVNAQKVRHLDLLLIHPWWVTIAPAVSDTSTTGATKVLVPNPVTFVGQKLLIRDKRKPAKRAQDALYIHDTLELFAGSLDQLNTLWGTTIRPGLHHKVAAQIERFASEQFSKVDDVLRDAALIPQDRQLGPERIRQLCHAALGRVFGR